MTRRILRQVHLWIGIALCLPLLVLGLTGSILVFEDDLDALLSPRPQAAMGEAKPVSEQIAAARSAAPAGFMPQSYGAPPPGGLATVRLTPPRAGGQRGQGQQAQQTERAGGDGAKAQNSAAAAPPPSPAEAFRVLVDPVSLATHPNPPEGVMRWIVNLHANLLIKGRDGRQLVGWLGVVMLVLGVSGLVNWFPYRAQWRTGQWRQAFGIRRGTGTIRFNRDVHGAFGIWGLVVFMIVSFGGVQLAFPETLRSIVDPIMPARDLRSAANAIKIEPQRGTEPMPVDEAIALARGNVPDSYLRFVFLPTRPDQPIRTAWTRNGHDRREPTVTVFIDPYARKIVETYDPRQFSAGETLLAWQHALHAGQGWGPVWKGLVFLCGFLPLLFSVTGLVMWWLKRRRRAAASVVPDAIDPVYSARRAGE